MAEESVNPEEMLQLAVGPDKPRGRAELYSPLNLAYIGDAVFSLLARTELIRGGSLPVNELSRRTAGLVRASAQAAMYRFLWDKLSEDERAVMKRGRNANLHSRAKNAAVSDYRMATGVEALFGYLYLKGEHRRVTELFDLWSEERKRA